MLYAVGAALEKHMPVHIASNSSLALTYLAVLRTYFKVNCASVPAHPEKRGFIQIKNFDLMFCKKNLKKMNRCQYRKRSIHFF